MADDKKAGTIIPDGETPPAGYIHVFGPLWISQTTLGPLDQAKKAFSNVDFTNPSCESAMAALKSVSNALQTALEMPKQLMKQAESLLDAAVEMAETPFNEAQKALDSALSSLASIEDAINDLASGATGPLSELKGALEKALECPLVGNTPMGQTIEALLDAIENNSPMDGLLDDLKKQFGSQISDQLEALKETPVEALNNLQKLMDDTLDRLDVSGLLQQMQGLEQCVAAACDMGKVASRLPESSEKAMKSIGAKFDSSTGKVRSAIANPKNAAQEAVTGTMSKVNEAKARIKSPILIKT